MRNDPLDKLDAFRKTHQHWLDQATLTLRGHHKGAVTPELLRDIGNGLEGAYQAGRAGLPEPEPVDWARWHFENHYGAQDAPAAETDILLTSPTGRLVRPAPEMQNFPIPGVRRIIRKRS